MPLVLVLLAFLYPATGSAATSGSLYCVGEGWHSNVHVSVDGVLSVSDGKLSFSSSVADLVDVSPTIKAGVIAGEFRFPRGTLDYTFNRYSGQLVVAYPPAGHDSPARKALFHGTCSYAEPLL